LDGLDVERLSIVTSAGKLLKDQSALEAVEQLLKSAAVVGHIAESMLEVCEYHKSNVSRTLMSKSPYTLNSEYVLTEFIVMRRTTSTIDYRASQLSTDNRLYTNMRLWPHMLLLTLLCQGFRNVFEPATGD
jgi:hypothetical protein